MKLSIERFSSTATMNNDSEQEKEILTQLIGPSHGDWTNDLHGWQQNSPVPLCDWEGIGCDLQGKVNQILLSNKSIKGTIPNDFGNLIELESLMLNDNALTGRIPHSISILPKLQEISLGNNQLEGSVPSFVSSKLSQLNLSFNVLEGSLATAFYGGEKDSQQPSMLKSLDLMNNHLTGTLSDRIGRWTSLETLSLSNNIFSGTIPASFGRLTSHQLTYVYMDQNRFVGTLPPELLNPTAHLKEVWLHENLLSGKIPIALANLPALDDLYIDGNKFTGTVPQSVCTDEVNADFVTSATTTTTTDGMTNLNDNLKHKCDKIACPIQTYSLEGVWPCRPCEVGTTMPYLGGEKRCFYRDAKDILRIFYETTQGPTMWQLPNNHFWFPSSESDETTTTTTTTTTINSDVCDFYGITCSEEGHVTGIQLKGIGLSGALPPELGFLEHLKVLDVSDNKLTGFLPSDLRFTQLESLDISGNLLRGPVPPLLCKKDTINENGQGYNHIYDCDFIACRPGTASSLGRRSLQQNVECRPCTNGANLLGLKDCHSYHAIGYGTKNDDDFTTTELNRKAGVVLLFFTVLAVFLFVAAVLIRRRQRKYHQRHGLTNVRSVFTEVKTTNYNNREEHEPALV